ncbi:MAG: hypothetical protein AAB582_01165 [Patescibacteria group bacterium]
MGDLHVPPEFDEAMLTPPEDQSQTGVPRPPAEYVDGKDAGCESFVAPPYVVTPKRRK